MEFPEKLLSIARDIRLLICDVDGVLTDGKIVYDDTGRELKSFFTLDGLGIKLLQQQQIEFAVITSRESIIVQKRMTELNVKYVYQRYPDKLIALNDLLNKTKVSLQQVAYVGDDLPDLPIIRRCGFGIAVANAVSEVKQYAQYTTHAVGGHGAVREVCELLMKAQGTWLSAIEKFL